MSDGTKKVKAPQANNSNLRARQNIAARNETRGMAVPSHTSDRISILAFIH